MPVRQIAIMGDEVLNQVAEEIQDPTSDETQALVTDLVDTMVTVGGLGMAAPQIGESKRAIIFRAPPGDDNCDPVERDKLLTRHKIWYEPLTALINPVVTVLTNETEDDWEGCLSVPALSGLVPRPLSISYSGYAPDGSKIDRVAYGFHARLVLHEADHLDGILYLARMNGFSQLKYISDLPDYARENLSRRARQENDSPRRQ